VHPPATSNYSTPLPPKTNFFLECGARAGKARVYEMTDDPTARAMIGYLLGRGGVHIVAYAKALEKLTGADVGRLLPIHSVSNKQFQKSQNWKPKACTRSCGTGAIPRGGSRPRCDQDLAQELGFHRRKGH